MEAHYREPRTLCPTAWSLMGSAVQVCLTNKRLFCETWTRNSRRSCETISVTRLTTSHLPYATSFVLLFFRLRSASNGGADQTAPPTKPLSQFCFWFCLLATNQPQSPLFHSWLRTKQETSQNIRVRHSQCHLHGYAALLSLVVRALRHLAVSEHGSTGLTSQVNLPSIGSTTARLLCSSRKVCL